jgi:hypothetical protein
MNTAKAAYEAAKQDFEQCQPPDQRAAIRAGEVKEALGRYETEAAQLFFMNEFLLSTLDKEAGNNETIVNLGAIAEREMQSIQDEIDGLKSEIRKERRRFLYFTKVPDNQVLIGLMSTLGAFLLVVSIAIMGGYIPGYLYRQTMGERATTVAIMWVTAAILMYLGLFIFT